MTSNAMQWLKTRRIASCARRERTQVLPYMVTTLDFGHKQCLQGAKLLSEGACRLQPTLTASQRQDRQLHVTNVTLPKPLSPSLPYQSPQLWHTADIVLATGPLPSFLHRVYMHALYFIWEGGRGTFPQ